MTIYVCMALYLTTPRHHLLSAEQWQGVAGCCAQNAALSVSPPLPHYHLREGPDGNLKSVSVTEDQELSKEITSESESVTDELLMNSGEQI